MNVKRVLAVVVLSVVLAGSALGCSEAEEPSDSSASTPSGVEQLLAEHDLSGMTPVEIVDHLDRLPGPERPRDLMASVRPDQLVLTGQEGTEHALALPEERFYLSVAPYVDQTHDCFHHSLTTCQGELTNVEVDVEVVDDTSGEVLVDERFTTFDNGFVGLWLPADVEATLRVTHDGRSAEQSISTDDEAPTCLTTVQLA